MELSPNYAGTLKGFTNTFGSVTGFVAPLIAGAITTGNVSCIYHDSDEKKVLRTQSELLQVVGLNFTMLNYYSEQA